MEPGQLNPGDHTREVGGRAQQPWCARGLSRTKSGL